MAVTLEEVHVPNTNEQPMASCDGCRKDVPADQLTIGYVDGPVGDRVPVLALCIGCSERYSMTDMLAVLAF
jgi:hypothetical protein